MPRLPPVEKSPQARLRATLWPGVGYSVVTFDQSHSSSSATSWASPVSVPWPISERATRMTTVLRGVALAGAAATGFVAPLVPAKADIFEEGDLQCRPTVHDKTPDYDINDALLSDFMNVSETLT